MDKTHERSLEIGMQTVSVIIFFYLFLLLLSGGTLVLLVRGLILFPHRVQRQGIVSGIKKYGLSALFTFCVLLYAVFAWTNVYGFSRKHMRWLSNDELVSLAINYRFKGKYKGLSDLRDDYPDFTPSVDYYFSHYINEYEYYTFARLMGDNTYRIKLPDTWVLMTADGDGYAVHQAQGSDRVPPRSPKFGVIAYFFLEDRVSGRISALPADSVRWAKGTGNSLVRANCLSAESSSSEAEINFRFKDLDALNISHSLTKGSDGQDYSLVYSFQVKGASNQGGSRAYKIDEEQFHKLKNCESAPQTAKR
jgi:hypothetical protein